jgi:hypothetical protein
MEDHNTCGAVALMPAQCLFYNLVGEMGHRTALSFGLMVQSRHQMPFDRGRIISWSGHGFSGVKLMTKRTENGSLFICI